MWSLITIILSILYVIIKNEVDFVLPGSDAANINNDV